MTIALAVLLVGLLLVYAGVKGASISALAFGRNEKATENASLTK